MPDIIRVEPTPNPNAFKFIADQTLVQGGALQFQSAEEAQDAPLAKALFDLGALVQIVYVMDDFVSVDAAPGADWEKIERTLREQIPRFTPVELPAADPNAPPAAPGGGDEMLTRVNQVIDQYVRPALAGDGGGLEILGMQGKTLTVRYQGACGNCPSAAAGTLFAIQRLLQEEVDQEIELVNA